MRIDAHMHINLRNISPDNIIGYLDRHRYDRCWLMTCEYLDPKRRSVRKLCVEHVYEAFLRHPARVIPMYAPDPALDDAREELLRWFGMGVKGCAELNVTVGWRSKKMSRLLETVREIGIPVVFRMEHSPEVLKSLDSDTTLEAALLRMMQSGRLKGAPGKMLGVLSELWPPLRKWKKLRTVFPGNKLDFASLRSMLRKHPATSFIGHGPLFWRHISDDGRGTGGGEHGPIRKEGMTCSLLRTCPNLYADISGPSGFNALDRDHAFSRRFLSEFSHKLLFGTDNYPLSHEELLRSLRPGPRVMRRIMGDNAQGLLMQ